MAAPAGPSGVWRAESERAHGGTQHGSHDAPGGRGGVKKERVEGEGGRERGQGNGVMDKKKGKG